MVQVLKSLNNKAYAEMAQASCLWFFKRICCPDCRLGKEEWDCKSLIPRDCSVLERASFFNFSNFQTSNHQKDYKSLEFRNCLKTGQLNCLHNHLIYKACPKTRQASPILHRHSIHWNTRLWAFCSKPDHTFFFVHWKKLLRKFGCVDEKIYLCGVN